MVYLAYKIGELIIQFIWQIQNHHIWRYMFFHGTASVASCTLWAFSTSDYP